MRLSQRLIRFYYNKAKREDYFGLNWELLKLSYYKSTYYHLKLLCDKGFTVES